MLVKKTILKSPQFLSLSLLAFAVFLVSLITTSCKKKPSDEETQPVTTGSVKVNVSHTVSGQNLQFGTLMYTNPAGNQYSFDLFKYFISNFTLVNQNGSSFNFGKYDLINPQQPSSCVIDASNIPNGTYTSLRFSIGIDSTRNHDIANYADMDPSSGMVWTWATGYIFYKHEGQYIDSLGQTQSLSFHLGTDTAYTVVQLNFSSPLVIDKNSRTINLNFNINSAYDSPELIDFNEHNIQSSVGEEKWVKKMRSNLQDAFTITSVQ